MTKTALWIVLASTLAACTSDDSKVEAKDARPADTASSEGHVAGFRLTDQVSGWSEEVDSFAEFDASNMFNLINGGAQPHVDHGLVEGIFQIMVGTERRVEIFSEDFGSETKAQSMYSYAKGGVADELSLAHFPDAALGDVVLGGAVFHVSFDRYYFKLLFTGYSTTERQELLTDAEAFITIYKKLATP